MASMLCPFCGNTEAFLYTRIGWTALPKLLLLRRGVECYVCRTSFDISARKELKAQDFDLGPPPVRVSLRLSGRLGAVTYKLLNPWCHGASSARPYCHTLPEPRT